MYSLPELCSDEPGGSKHMPDEPLTIPRLLTATIVGSYLRRNQVPADQLATVIATVHQTLLGLRKPAEEPTPALTPAVPIRRSFSRDHVVCLECGWRGKVLRRHLRTRHALTPEEYRARWNLKPDHLLIAPAYSERRSVFAKELGLGGRRSARRGRRRGQRNAPETQTP
jgi:predicted transcriptional regulator